MRVSSATDDNALLGSATSIDGDGLHDLAVAAPGAGEGGVYLFYAGTVTAASDLDVATADASIYGETVGDFFGMSLDTAGDPNGDGVGDVVASAPKHNSTNGVAYLFYGPISGTSGAGAADFTILGLDSEYLGNSVVFPGDLDADGFDDLAVAAPMNTLGFSYLQGAAFVFYGAGP